MINYPPSKPPTWIKCWWLNCVYWKYSITDLLSSILYTQHQLCVTPINNKYVLMVVSLGMKEEYHLYCIVHIRLLIIYSLVCITVVYQAKDRFQSWAWTNNRNCNKCCACVSAKRYLHQSKMFQDRWKLLAWGHYS